MGVIPFVKDRVTFLIYNKDDVLIDALEVEATLAAQHRRHAQVSRHPVAKGQSTTDNVRPDPNGLTLDCFWGNRAVDPILFGQRYARGIFNASEAAYEKLNNIFVNAYRLTINMRLWTYENMVIEDIGVPETVEDGASLKASVQFSEIKTVSAFILNAQTAVKTKTTKLAPKASNGAKGTSAVNATQKGSILTKAADASGASSNFTLIKR